MIASRFRFSLHNAHNAMLNSYNKLLVKSKTKLHFMLSKPMFDHNLINPYFTRVGVCILRFAKIAHQKLSIFCSIFSLNDAIRGFCEVTTLTWALRYSFKKHAYVQGWSRLFKKMRLFFQNKAATSL